MTRLAVGVYETGAAGFRPSGLSEIGLLFLRPPRADRILSFSLASLFRSSAFAFACSPSVACNAAKRALRAAICSLMSAMLQDAIAHKTYVAVKDRLEEANGQVNHRSRTFSGPGSAWTSPCGFGR